MAVVNPSESECRVNSHPAPDGVEMLMEVWRSVLGRLSVGIDDNFFRIGGSVRSADLMFAEISRRLGRELPSAIIFQAPTVASLASLLDQPILPRFSPFVQLKSGDRNPSIVIAHGLDGRASFSGLAERIRTEHAIYGIQAKGVDGMEKPLDRIEDMAEFYLDALAALRLQEPPILIGYSFGGLVALEMAQRLSQQKKNIELLVMIDSYPHPRYLSVGQRLRLGAQRIKRRAFEMRQRPLRDSISYFMERVEDRLRIAGLNTGGQTFPEASPLSLAQTTFGVKRKAYVALARYRPRAYSGKIKFIKSETDTYFPGDPIPVWAHLASNFEVEIVRGSHLNMVTTHYEGLADVLTRFLAETEEPE
jgi:thioesterase domain-containing protein